MRWHGKWPQATHGTNRTTVSNNRSIHLCAIRFHCLRGLKANADAVAVKLNATPPLRPPLFWYVAYVGKIKSLAQYDLKCQFIENL